MNARERFLAACNRQPVDRPPVWVMRQAGRYLPEYMEVRAKHDFLEVCRSPELVTEVTMQPLRRFDLDAAIIFSDILVVPDAMGQTVTYPKGGPKLAPPIREASDLKRIKDCEPEKDLGYVADALQMMRKAMGEDRALLGFAGAPYTLATYMVEGGGSKNQEQTKKLALNEPELMDDLLERLADGVAGFLKMQIEAGADCVQIFDTWAGDLSPTDFERLALTPVRRVTAKLAPLGVPIIYFMNGIAPHLEAAAQSGATALGIDWRLDLAEARRRTGGKLALQGNLDPLVLSGPTAVVRERVRAIHDSLEGAPGHIFNLGHGVLPTTPIEGVAAFVDAVHELAP